MALLDKYTKIDDLLRQNQIVQSDLLAQQQLTNRLLIAWLQGMGTNNISPTTGIGIDVSELAKTVQTGASRYKSIAIPYKNKTVTGDWVVYEARESGAVQELTILSDSSVAANGVYSIQIQADGNIIYDDSYSNFETLSDYLTDMTAFDDGTYYVLTFNNVFYNESVYIRIYGSTATFAYVNLKIVKRLEAGIR